MPIVLVKMEGKELGALLDPGATRSFIDPKVADELGEFVQELHTPFEFVCAGGIPMIALKIIDNAVLDVDRWSGRHPLFVGRLGYDIILGYDVLTKIGVLWDFRDCTVQFVRENVLSEDKKTPVWQKVLCKTEVKPLSVPGVPIDYLQALTWVGKESLRKIEATKRYRANMKNKTKFVKGVEPTHEQREEEPKPELQKDPMYLIMPPPKEKKGPRLPSVLRRGKERKEEETFHFPSGDEFKEWKQGKGKGIDSVHSVCDRQRSRDVSAEVQVVDNGYTCSVQQMRKWMGRKQVKCVMAVKVSVDEPIINAQSVKAYTQTEIELPSETPKSKGIVLEERFRVLLDSHANVFREIPPGGITERVQKHHIETIPGLVPNYRRQLYPMSEERLHKLEELIQTLIQRGFIVPSSSPIAAPVFFGEKKAGAPSTFQGVMQNTFTRELDEYVVVYLDDVLVYLKTKELHYAHLKVVLQRRRDARLFVGLSKCELVTQKVQYLGFVIEPGGVGPDPEKVEAIQQWPTELLYRKQLRGFLGMVGYYRRLIPNFNRWAHPLYGLLREESDMTWWPVHTEAVQRLKDTLATVTLLKIYDPDKELTIKTDASKYATGAVLEQEGQPIAFESKKLGVREQFIPAYESELLSIVYALMKWKQLMGTKKVRVKTDHAPLGKMLTQNNVTPRLGYWLEKLADFDIEVVYKPGKQNAVADALSRRPDFIGAIVQTKKRGVRLVTEEARWSERYTKCKDFKEKVKACERHQEGEQGDKGLNLEKREYRWKNH
ncbi:retrotransposon ty3-gypsy subclass [Cystoisospora suis]|uniref:RNA-directed DNA polymerase n=1 Tax=Cystoisospora suis TaxID=483139 RepID=A0A2C6KRM6_9APIC|nr:retrotransposon ty3-gypsy subclass [Cystoisospora suis]